MTGGSSSPAAGEMDQEGDALQMLLTSPLGNCTMVAWATRGLLEFGGPIFSDKLYHGCLGYPRANRIQGPLFLIRAGVPSEEDI